MAIEFGVEKKWLQQYVDSRWTGITLLQKQSRNTGKDQYTYRSLILHLLRWKLVQLRKEGTLWIRRVHPRAWSKKDKQAQLKFEREMGLCYVPAYFHGKFIRWSTFACDNDSLSLHFVRTPVRTSGTVRHSCGKHGGREVFSCMRNIEKSSSVIICWRIC